MPPRSKALASAVEAVSSSTLRRSSRRSIPTSVPYPQRASLSSSSACSTSSTSEPRPKRPRIKSEPDTAANDTPSQSRTSRGKPTIRTDDDAPVIKPEPIDDTSADVKPTATKKRRTKKEAEAQDEIFPPRPPPHVNGTQQNGDRRGSGLFIGAHISSAGGVENAPLNALRIGGNAFSCFVRPKMQWASNPIPSTSVESFRERVVQHDFMPRSHSRVKKEGGISGEIKDNGQGEGYGYVVPHGCYLVNLANPELEKREKSFEAFIDDLQRCEQLGIRLFNFHPGSMTAASATGEDLLDVAPLSEVRAAKAEACALVASYINRAHAQTGSVVILIENMAGSKNDTILGSSLHDLAAMLSHVTDKSRVGVCIDTCHAFAAGYDFITPATYSSFTSLIDSTVGWENVRAFHLNDSKFALGCKRDRHANIGRGHIGLGGFWSIINDERWHGIPLILETPALGNAMAAYPAKEATKKMHQVWSYQIQALYSLRGTKWQQWKEAEEWLEKADRVVEEAENLHASKKGNKASKKAAVGKNKANKKASEDEEESDLSSEE
ncbi:related to APN1 - AP endonuclease [Ustilago trichophora]|uniref:Related to APN1 - AP endonuclease n=1 Tax=Ustilago trichophora TaxID=86804 RepID=A0A5C3DQX7_9BASI|nr:related to APN1 - AP endonuclease [Ustilago trichophora]